MRLFYHIVLNGRDVELVVFMIAVKSEHFRVVPLVQK